MKKLFLSLAVVIGFLPAITFAAQIKGGEEYASQSTEVVSEDLYIGAGLISVGAKTEGDLIAAGGDITIGGDVSQDLIVAGGNITVLSNVGDDVRIAGGDLLIAGTIEGDLVVVGGNVKISPTAVVKGDLIAAGGVVFLDGVVEQNVKVTSGSFIINGKVDGLVEVETDEFKIGDNAVINGDVNYKAVSEVKVSDSATINGTLNFEQRQPKHRGNSNDNWFAQMFFAAWLTKLVLLLVSALVIFWLTPKTINESVYLSMGKFGNESLRGFLLLIATPIALIILAVTLVGLPLALLSGLVLAVLVTLAKLISGILLGAIIWKWLKYETPLVNWKSIVVGVVVLQIAGAVPVLGWIFACVVFLASLGGLSNYLYQYLINTK